jgi:hypothetical protein
LRQGKSHENASHLVFPRSAPEAAVLASKACEPLLESGEGEELPAPSTSSVEVSVNTDPSRGCVGKQRFETYSEAARIASRSVKRKETIARAYHCKHCNGFHWGTSQNRISKKLKPAMPFRWIPGLEEA